MVIFNPPSSSQIYDCLDIIDAVVWPSERMRNNGGRLSWKDWEPSAGMVGNVVHCWTPNHKDKRFRSHVNRCVYLVEIGERYVPVEELGLREYNQIMGSNEDLANARLSSIQRNFHEYNKSLNLPEPSKVYHHKAKIRAVSSSSSEEDDKDGADAADLPLPSLDLMNFNTLVSMWKVIADKNKRGYGGGEFNELAPELLQKLDEAAMAQIQANAKEAEAAKEAAAAAREAEAVQKAEAEDAAKEDEPEKKEEPTPESVQDAEKEERKADETETKTEVETEAESKNEDQDEEALEEVTVTTPEEQPATPPPSPVAMEHSTTSNSTTSSPSLSLKEGQTEDDEEDEPEAKPEEAEKSPEKEDDETGTTV